jgi:hypothetical protein
MTRHAAIGALAGVLLAAAGTPPAAAPLNVSVSRANAITVGSRATFSSSTLLVSWTPSPDDQTQRFEIVATEAAQGTEVRASVAGTATSAALTGLKAATTYSVIVTACLDEACSRSSAAAPATGTTDNEVWRLRGSGNTVSGLTAAVSDGNARLSATRFGPTAGGMANRIQLYYGPRPLGGLSPSLSVAVASGPADAANAASYLTFTSRANASGLISPSSPSTLVSQVATGQGVPVAGPAGGFVRLFFEAMGADGRTRVLSVDSADGYTGLDFNRGTETTCSTAADYSPGGGCVPTVLIAVDGDAGGNARITNARQHKVAWPRLDAPHWDLSPGTFMVFTTDRVQGCSTFTMNHGYAVWDGAAWKVQYRADGCPKLFTSAQAAFPFHSGGARYRLYYGDPSIADGQVAGSRLPWLGPKKLIYADGRMTGAAEVVDFEDWELQTSARDVVFMWPNGDQMNATAEGYIDDYHFLTPTGDSALQVMYITITDGAIPPISATAILTNP